MTEIDRLKAELESLALSLQKALDAKRWVEQYEIAKQIQRTAFQLYLATDQP